ncbi:hypothetical protein [Actinokineospora sp. NBRC 105648]|uniref:hypothetical protein n=1 Tax=Actinokineospora sp. NBRC 105648 TaxID=3032206 RepID=UPI0024A4EDCF|nr:hypothetical protein [Actinokineospora sp. NBRC 105648]GLZ43378.1 hypothetical protein Acsp05_70020 [Actinokineospora sp. NBRC 105648]
MTDGPQWPDDNLIGDLINRVVAEVGRLAVHGTYGDTGAKILETPGLLSGVENRLWMETSDILTLSPPKIWDNFGHFAEVMRDDYQRDVLGAFTAVRDSLVDWNGVAAEQFTAHLGMIEHFARAQNDHLNEQLIALASAYVLAVQVREDFKRLVDKWVEVSREFREADAERRAGVELKIGAAVVAAVVGAATAGAGVAVGLLVLSGAATVGVEVYTPNLGGETPDDVWKSFQAALTEHRQRYLEAVDRIQLRLVGYRDGVSAPTQLFSPLPSSVDVDSPDFRYENFSHRGEAPPGFGSQVDRRRGEYVAEKQAPPGLISRALDGDPGAN